MPLESEICGAPGLIGFALKIPVSVSGGLKPRLWLQGGGLGLIDVVRVGAGTWFMCPAPPEPLDLSRLLLPPRTSPMQLCSSYCVFFFFFFLLQAFVPDLLGCRPGRPVGDHVLLFHHQRGSSALTFELTSVKVCLAVRWGLTSHCCRRQMRRRTPF